MLCSSHCIVSVAQDLDLPMIGDVHFDRLIKVLSAKLLYYSVSPFATGMDFLGHLL